MFITVYTIPDGPRYKFRAFCLTSSLRRREELMAPNCKWFGKYWNSDSMTYLSKSVSESCWTRCQFKFLRRFYYVVDLMDFTFLLCGACRAIVSWFYRQFVIWMVVLFELWRAIGSSNKMFVKFYDLIYINALLKTICIPTTCKYKQPVFMIAFLIFLARFLWN